MVVDCKRSFLSFFIILAVFFIFTPALFGQSKTARVYSGEYIVRLAEQAAPGVQQRTRSRGKKIRERKLTDGRRLALYRDSARPSQRMNGSASLNAQLEEYDSAVVDEFCNELAKEVALESCEPNGYVEIEALPVDTLYEDLYAMPKVNAPAAWDLTTGSTAVTIAVLDTGIDYTHPDLSPNMWTNSGEINGNGIDDDKNGYVDDYYGYDFINNDGDPYDDNGHGTHVAGTIGAAGNNSMGVVGLNWKASIMGLKFLGAGGGGSILDAITALDFAIAHDVDIINASFGSTVPSAEFEKAIRRARDAGILFVAASGNSSKNTDAVPHYPSCYDIDNIISVAATDSSDNLAYFSNYGKNTVDVAAPGVQILSTFPGGKYAKLNGTSMAAPHVAGLAGLVLAQNPTFSYRKLKNAIMTSADSLLSLKDVVSTSGRINAFKAVQSDGEGTVPEPIAGEKVQIKSFGHRKFRKTLFKRKNFRMVFRGEAGSQFSAQLEMDGIFDGSCSLGTYQLPADGALTLKARLNLRNWMWYTRNIILSTGTDTVTRSVKSKKAYRNRILHRKIRSRAHARYLRAKSQVDAEDSYAAASCESILSTLKVVGGKN